MTIYCSLISLRCKFAIINHRVQSIYSALVNDIVDTNEIIKNSICCSMCKRLVINAGIKTVIVRDTPEEYRVIDVADWIKNDESIAGEFGY